MAAVIEERGGDTCFGTRGGQRKKPGQTDCCFYRLYLFAPACGPVNRILLELAVFCYRLYILAYLIIGIAENCGGSVISIADLDFSSFKRFKGKF